eukprot:IDg7974t1
MKAITRQAVKTKGCTSADQKEILKRLLGMNRSASTLQWAFAPLDSTSDQRRDRETDIERKRTIDDNPKRIGIIKSGTEATDSNGMPKRHHCNKSRWQHLICDFGKNQLLVNSLIVEAKLKIIGYAGSVLISEQRSWCL